MDIKDSVLTVIMRNCRIATRFFDKKFKEKKCPINSTQYDLLRTIGNETQKFGISVLELGKALEMDPSTVSRRIPFFIDSGYVEIKYMDGRTKNIKLTKEGEKILKEWAELYRQCDIEFQSREDLIPETPY